MEKRARVGVVGVGVVGGTLAEVLADAGYTVRCYDPNKGMKEPEILWDCDVVFVCVWTPMADDGLDTSSVEDAVKTVVRNTTIGTLVVVRSTVPPGFMTDVQNEHPDWAFAFAPEFLVEADPLGSMRKADRIVVGTHDSKRAQWLESIMRDVTPGAPIVRVSPEEAVMVKLASNGLLAAKVALANELYDVCNGYGVDWETVRGAVGLDRRIGPDHLRVTEERGYGGSCFPKDVRGLIGAGALAGVPTPIFETIEKANDEVREAAKIIEEVLAG